MANEDIKNPICEMNISKMSKNMDKYILIGCIGIGIGIAGIIIAILE